jgi:hypothetical protein
LLLLVTSKCVALISEDVEDGSADLHSHLGACTYICRIAWWDLLGACWFVQVEDGTGKPSELMSVEIKYAMV